MKLIYKLSELENNIKWSTQKLIMFQAGIINLCNEQADNANNLSERVEKIEKYLRSGNLKTSANNVILNNASNITSNTISNSVVNKPSIKTEKQTTASKNYSNKSEEYWPQIVNDLKQNGKIVLYTNLLNSKAVEINDMTVGIEFPNGLTSFGKTILEKQENIREISKLISIACGKEMQIKYIDKALPKQEINNAQDIQNLVNGSDIPFNVVE